jgi:hypothetical protein
MQSKRSNADTPATTNVVYTSVIESHVISTLLQRQNRAKMSTVSDLIFAADD